MSDRDPETASPKPAADASSCHPDVMCPVCAARGKFVRMQPIKAHVQCPECRYFDSCCM